MSINSKRISHQSGMTMIELMIVLVIVGVLAILFLMGVRTQIAKGRDAKRKDDLQKIKIVYEDYYSDNDCYPPEGALDKNNSASDTLLPYMTEIPRDPLTDDPYVYMPLPELCPGYRIFAQLEMFSDPDIFSVGCLADMCGFSPEYQDVNYGVASGTQVPEDGFDNGGIAVNPEDRSHVISPGLSCVAYNSTSHAEDCPIFFNSLAGCQASLDFCVSQGTCSGTFACTND